MSAPTPTPQEGRHPGPALHCLPGRSVHPSGQSSESAVGNRPTGALSFGALRAIAAGMARVYQPQPAAADHWGEVSSVRLLRTAFYDAWLVTWPVGSDLEPHDHGAARLKCTGSGVSGRSLRLKPFVIRMTKPRDAEKRGDIPQRVANPKVLLPHFEKLRLQ